MPNTSIAVGSHVVLCNPYDGLKETPLHGIVRGVWNGKAKVRMYHIGTSTPWVDSKGRVVHHTGLPLAWLKRVEEE